MTLITACISEGGTVTSLTDRYATSTVPGRGGGWGRQFAEASLFIAPLVATLVTQATFFRTAAHHLQCRAQCLAAGARFPPPPSSSTRRQTVSL